MVNVPYPSQSVATQLLIQLPANVPGKASDMGPVPHVGDQASVPDPWLYLLQSFVEGTGECMIFLFLFLLLCL